MTPSQDPPAAKEGRGDARAFRELERRLIRRRIAQLDPWLRFELVVLALLIGAFLFWQVRVPLDGLRRHAGPVAVLQTLGIAWLVLALFGAVLVAERHRRRLCGVVAGPVWLALPIAPEALGRHLAWESRGHALWVALPGLGALVAAIGLAPAGWLALLGAAFVPLLMAAARIGAAVGERIALRGAGRPGLAPLIARLAETGVAAGRRRVGRARWRRGPAWLALSRKDLATTRRLPGVRGSLFVALTLWALSLGAWSLAGEPALRHFAAFALTLLGAAAFAEALVVLSGSDPFATLRTLPLGVGSLWLARFAWAVVAVAVLSVGHAIAGRELSPHAMRVFLVWTGAATLGIAALGVNYGVTLFPRADAAQRLLGLSLGLAVAASVMIPLSGWIVLLSAILHSARRLPRWSRLEET